MTARRTRERIRYRACPECGCTSTQVVAWIDGTTNEYSGDDLYENDNGEHELWCPQCEKVHGSFNIVLDGGA